VTLFVRKNGFRFWNWIVVIERRFEPAPFGVLNQWQNIFPMVGLRHAALQFFDKDHPAAVIRIRDDFERIGQGSAK